jgi:hypothetical protein
MEYWEKPKTHMQLEPVLSLLLAPLLHHSRRLTDKEKTFGCDFKPLLGPGFFASKTSRLSRN